MAFEGIVLLIDDDENIHYLVERAFSKNNKITFLASQSIANAREVLKDLNPDLILLDQELPTMQGEEFLEELKSNQQTKEAEVVFLSGKLESGDITSLLEKGALDIIEKPISPGDLLKQVDKIWQNR